ncbi:Uncharacterised protein [Serratia fonticola]|uniref:Uncharacterized protein n=1 Tax=Serratia fonticola TaxID=47917 RepID=A0A448SZ73_SERFO|nr:Uncharacterised protein [Serratia fonticola]VEI72929.1 Uncharacterised protein [Serratia fonticola]
MQLMISAASSEKNQPLASGKTSLESSTAKTTPSAACLQHLPERMSHCSHQGENGRTLVMCLDPKEQSRGSSKTPNTSEWPNAAVVCSLSQVLVRDSIPPRYYLSSIACAGILRRAEKRGRKLPPLLQTALERVVQTTIKPQQDT